MELRDSKGNGFTVLDSPIARGGEGNVHRVTSKLYEGYCVKIFHTGKIDSRKKKLEYQISHPLTAPVSSVYRICWPLDFAYNEEGCIGFIMPLAFEGSRSLYDLNLKDGSSVFKRITKTGIENRAKLLYNIANVMSIIHENGYVLSDFKPQNLLYTDSGYISMIDMDSVQISINGEVVYGSTAVTAEYAYPKELNHLGSKPLSSSWDVYSFAIVAYQILLGIHPFTASTEVKDYDGNSISSSSQLMACNLFPFGPRAADILAKPPIHNYFLQLPETLQAMFVNTFNLDKTPPSMKEWMDVLYCSVQDDLLVPNMFRAQPREPIFILTYDSAKSGAMSDYVTITWLTFFCDNLEINGDDKTHVNSCTILLPEDRRIQIVARNSHKSNTVSLYYPYPAIYCTRCGNRFEQDDNFCTHCGTKREQ